MSARAFCKHLYTSTPTAAAVQPARPPPAAQRRVDSPGSGGAAPQYFDLTDGNCDGKAFRPTEYDELHGDELRLLQRVGVGHTLEGQRRLELVHLELAEVGVGLDLAGDLCAQVVGCRDAGLLGRCARGLVARGARRTCSSGTPRCRARGARAARAAADTRLVAATLRLRVRTAASLSVRLIPMLDSAKTSVRDELKRGFISLLYSRMISSLFLWSSVQLALALIEFILLLAFAIRTTALLRVDNSSELN